MIHEFLIVFQMACGEVVEDADEVNSVVFEEGFDEFLSSYADLPNPDRSATNASR